MRFVAAALLGLCFATQGFAQAQADTYEPVSSQDYQRIEAVRARESAAFDAQEAVCYQRFAVNDCLKQVQSRRRALLADLKRQEARLHEREHAQQGVEALQRIRQKALEAQQSKADSQAGDGAVRAQEKLQEQKDKQAAHAAKAVSGTAPASAPAPSGPGVAEQTRAREAFARKQADAEKKRQEVAARLAEKAAKPGKPLPVPP
jgi:colicin import membrane protein